MKFLHLSDLHITAKDTVNEPIGQGLAKCDQDWRSIA